MDEMTATIDVGVPLHVAYNQWTQFEEFPTFMEGIESVRQLDDTHMHWTAEIAGVHREWDAEIIEQTPDRLIAWKATDGTANAGAVTFEGLGEGTTRLSLKLDVDPQGIVEKIGDKLGFIRHRAEGDLARFKEMVEARGVESGAWRGSVDQHSSDQARA